MKTHAIILAAGKGTRMKSDLPKVLHPVCGMPMVEHLVHKLKRLNVDDIIIVVGHQAEMIKQHFGDSVQFVEQNQQLGTAHAVSQASSLLNGKPGTTLILNGDAPLIEEETLERFLSQHVNSNSKGTVLTTVQENPKGYGRIVRVGSELAIAVGVTNHSTTTYSDAPVLKIVEEKDATQVEKQISEVNSGIFCFDNETLFDLLPLINNNNAQNEFYLTDIVEVFRSKQIAFQAHKTENSQQLMGVNSRAQLAEVEKYLRSKINEMHMDNGVTLIDPENTYIEPNVKIGYDTVIYPGTYIKGNTVIGSKCLIEGNCIISNSTIENNVHIISSVINDSSVGNDVTIGPFAQLRPASILKDKTKVGNFVEVKNSTLGAGTKVNHLSYIGDAEIGANVNVGCGTITVNYDGKKKHKTIVEDGAFVGCNANLVAPVTVGKNAIVAAGSTITNNVPEDALAIARDRQVNKEGYAPKFKK